MSIAYISERKIYYRKILGMEIFSHVAFVGKETLGERLFLLILCKRPQLSVSKGTPNTSGSILPS